MIVQNHGFAFVLNKQPLGAKKLHSVPLTIVNKQTSEVGFIDISAELSDSM